jgi:S1-C subfamily serine protease
VGDAIVAIDGKDVADLGGYAKVLASYDPGEVVEVTVVRENKRLTLKLTLGARP